MKRFVHTLAFLAVAATMPRVDAGCWAGIDPSVVARTCPVIVSGEIVEISEGTVRAGGRVLDVAHIKVTAVHKNELRDVQVKVGGILDARMHSRKDEIAVSTDLRYPVGTTAMWMLYLGDDGALCINRRPEQCQRDKDAARKIPLGKERLVVARADGTAGPLRFARAEWIAAQQAERRAITEEQQAWRDRMRARDEAIRQAVDGLYDDDTLQPKRLPSLLKLPDEARSDLVNRSARQLDISQSDWITLRCYLARNDPIENHRVRALPPRIYGSERCRELLLESLADKSPRMRLFACQALMFSKDTDPAIVASVARLLDDESRDVQMMAVRALGRMGSTGHVGRILALYHQRPPSAGEAASFGRALAQLGEVAVPLECFQKAMTSDNWNIRHGAVLILYALDSRKVVPAAIAALPGELRRTIRDRRDHGVGDRVLNGLVAILARYTGQKHGKDVVAWLTWWQEAGRDYGCKDTRFDAHTVRQLQAEYHEVFGGAAH